MRHWDERAESLLANARSVNPVPADARARVRKVLQGSLALSAAGSAIGVPAVHAKLPAAVKGAMAALPKTVTAVAPLGPVSFLAPLTVGIALGVSAISPSEVSVPERAAVVVASAPQQAVSRAVVSEQELQLSEPPPESKPTQRALPTSSAATPSSPRSSAEPASSLKLEVTALEHARVVLRQGDAELALRLLDRYRAEFPKATLSFEASAIRAVALCQLGRIDDGFGILARLELTAPGSGIVAQARAACGATATPNTPRQATP